MSKKTGIWTWNLDSVKDNLSPHVQNLQHAKSYAQIKNWDIIEIYDLHNPEDRSIYSHSETKRLMKDIKSGRINVLICSKMADLGCNTKELIEIVEFFNEHKADLVLLKEAIDTSTLAGRNFYTHIHALNECENEECARRVRVTIPKRAKAGKPLGGAAPFGYKWVNKQLEINEDEAPIRKFMFERFSTLKSKKALARELNEQGFRTRRGYKFTDTTVNRLLKDRIVIGERIVNYTQSMGHKKHWKKKPECEWVKVSVPAIISKELYNKVQSIFNTKNKPSNIFEMSNEC